MTKSPNTFEQNMNNQLTELRHVGPRMNMLVATRGPASLQTCAAAHSRGKAHFPNTPASEHAARWWPNTPSWRPHRQVRGEACAACGRVGAGKAGSAILVALVFVAMFTWYPRAVLRHELDHGGRNTLATTVLTTEMFWQ